MVLFILFFIFQFVNISFERREFISYYNIFGKTPEDYIPCVQMLFSGGMTLNNIICILEFARDFPDLALNFIDSGRDVIIEEIKKNLIKNNITFLNNLVDDFFNGNYFDYLEDIIRDENSKFMNCTIDIVNNIVANNTDFEFYLGKGIEILNIEGMDKVFNITFQPKHTDTILDLFEYILKKFVEKENVTNSFTIIKPFFKNYSNILIPLVYEIIKSFDDSHKINEVIINFLTVKVNNTNFINDFKDVLVNENVREFFSFLMPVKHAGNIIKEEILHDTNIIKGFFEFIQNKDILSVMVNVIRYNNNSTYIKDELPKIFPYIRKINASYLELVLDLSTRVLRRYIRQDIIDTFVTEDIVDHLYKDYFENKLYEYKVGNFCIESLHNIYFKNYEHLKKSGNDTILKELTEMRYFYLKKAFIDTTKEKNDFLTYENCLSKEFNQTSMEKYNFSFTFQPIYILGMFDDSRNKTSLYDSILLEKYNYWLSYCLPYPISVENKTEICKQEDYSNILRVFMAIPFNMDVANVKSFTITDKKLDSSYYLYSCVSLFLLFIPVLIRIFLYVYNIISYKKYKNTGIIINKLINENKDKKEIIKDSKEKLIDEEKLKQQYKKNSPKWYKYLKEYFDIIKNIKELFNFDVKKTNINNINGITYVKGLLGISMLLYIFGQTFLILFNLPFKDFMISSFNNSIRNPFYVLSHIGLRYSPRVILSCSGYTLTYKFLSFIDQEPTFYLPKFYLLQSYKYLLLTISIFYIRYLAFYLTSIFTRIKKPMLEILRFNLDNNNNNFLIGFFTFLLGFEGDYNFQDKQNIIQYFYLPLNEIVCFIIGTLLISIGYKCKWRIDIIIIILIIIIFISKIFLFLFDAYSKQKYSTLFFYLYDYGAMMLNPLFNLSCFLIGMYFGLINYSTQKGVYLYKYDAYQKINSTNERESSIYVRYSELSKVNTLVKQPTMDRKDYPKEVELNNLYNASNTFDKKNPIYERNYSEYFEKEKNGQNTINKGNKNQFQSYLNKSIITKDDTYMINEFDEYDQKIDDMPFLKTPTKFLNFHRQNEGKFYFKILIYFFIIAISLFCCVPFIYLGKYDIMDKDSDKNQEKMENLSFRKIITNKSLNIIYVIDIELVVFMVNWGFFILYSRGYKTADIYDFFNNNFWSFFIKSYFSFIITSTAMILGIFYQIDSVIKFDIINVILFSFMNIILVFIVTIAFYILYEIPLKKIFKSFLVKEDIFDNFDDNALDEEEFEDEE